MAIFNQYDVVILPFPFSDNAKTKNRPALIINKKKPFSESTDHSVCAMITSQKNEPWPLDCQIHEIAEAGLPAPSVIRMKLFTIDGNLIKKKIGTLSEKDQANFKKSLDALLLQRMPR